MYEWMCESSVMSNAQEDREMRLKVQISVE